MRDITIRSFNSTSAAEYVALAELWNAITPEYPRVAEEMREDDLRYGASGQPWGCFVAIEAGSGKWIGMAHFGPSLWQPGPGKFHIKVRVLPTHQGRGIGKALYDHLRQEMEPHHPTWVKTQWRTDMDRAVRFFTERGFTEVERYYESRLSLTGFDFAPFADDFDRPLAHGITLHSWRDLQESDPDARRKLWAATMEMSADVPSSEPFVPMPFDQFWSFIMDRPTLDPDGFFVAVDSATGEYAGLSHIWRRRADNDLDTGLTAVKRAHRRKGIALALKLRILRWAVANGFRAIRTENDVANRPMLSINERLGFEKVPPWIELLWRADTTE